MKCFGFEADEENFLSLIFSKIIIVRMNASRLIRDLFIIAAVLTIFNLLLLDDIKISEEWESNLRGRNETVIEFLLQEEMRNYPGMNSTDQQKIREFYIKAYDETLVERNQKILEYEDNTFTFGVTFMHGVGIFTRSIGEWMQSYEIKVKGDMIHTYFPRAQRELLDPDTSTWFNNSMAYLGYVTGKNLAITVATFLLTAALLLKLFKNKQ